MIQSLLKKDEVEKAIENCVKIIEKNMHKFKEAYPSPATVDNKYEIIGNIEWTNGFWTGMLWLAYEYTKDEKFKQLAEKNVQSFVHRIDNKIEVGHHDMGFLYTLSCGASYRLTGDEKSKDALIKSANQLIGRYQPKGEFIQAWGELGKKQDYRLIIDCLLNIPLLYYVSELTGDRKYRDIAYKHYKTSCKTVIRDDYSTFHTFYMDTDTGEALKGVTRQGFSDDSSWARGQAWGIYGLALNYKYTKEEDIFPLYKGVTNYFLGKLPKDSVCYWDLIFKDGDDHSRDTSAAAIAVCGISEMLKYLPEVDEDKERYKYTMHTILKSLIENYSNDGENDDDALIYEGVYSYHSNKGVNEGNIWGDYFYLEALLRFYKDLSIYW